MPFVGVYPAFNPRMCDLPLNSHYIHDVRTIPSPLRHSHSSSRSTSAPCPELLTDPPSQVSHISGATVSADAFLGTTTCLVSHLYTRSGENVDNSLRITLVGFLGLGLVERSGPSPRLLVHERPIWGVDAGATSA